MTWYAIRTATRQELKAGQALAEIGIVVYAPCETRLWRHARKEELRAYPLLSGYIFADFAPADVPAVKAADFVSAIIGGPTDQNRRGSPIPERYLAWLMACEHLGAFNREKTIEPTYQPGRKVRVRSGKMTGALGEIQAAKGQKRFYVLLEAFGRLKRFDIAKADLEAA